MLFYVFKVLQTLQNESFDVVPGFDMDAGCPAHKDVYSKHLNPQNFCFFPVHK